MRNAVALVALVLVSCDSDRLENADIEGRWIGTVVVVDSELPQNCRASEWELEFQLAQVGGQVTGDGSRHITYRNGVYGNTGCSESREGPEAWVLEKGTVTTPNFSLVLADLGNYIGLLSEKELRGDIADSASRSFYGSTEDGELSEEERIVFARP